MEVRPVTPDDATLLFAWANDPRTRARSLSTGPIAWPDHLAWLERVLADPDRHLLLGEVDGVPVGTVRFDLDGDRAEVSITVAPAARGRRLGRPLLDAALEHADVAEVVAHVRPDNAASLRLFSHWHHAGEVVVGGVTVLRFTTVP